LEPHKIKVKVGQKINEGEILGFSGQNGWCLEPHLHFMIVQPNSNDSDLTKGFKSLIIQWKSI
jgi:murein DD-endopeptidase MepM/ murein hydrolase activator NlpD